MSLGEAMKDYKPELTHSTVAAEVKKAEAEGKRAEAELKKQSGKS